MAEPEESEVSIEERFEKLKEDAEKGIELEEEDIENDEMIQQTRKKFKRLKKRV